jgi:transglutaminase-like putative cysteine protease
MQSASRSGRLELEGVTNLPGQVWESVRGSMSGGRTWSAILVLLLTFNIARSTATFHWVDGIDAVTPIALLGALLLGALAVSPLSEPIALVVGAVFGPPVAVLGAWQQIHLHHTNAVLGPQLLGMWWSAAKDGSLTSDTSFFLVLICLLMWITGGWLSWCVLRWRKPMLGLIPGAAAFATNLLNIVPGSSDQNSFTLAMLVLTIALLLWTNYTSSIANAVRAHVKLTGDARWDFWESGLVAMMALIVLSIFLPQLSTADRTVDVESGMFSSWAQLQQELSHPGFINTTRGGAGTTGFTDDVKLSGSLQRTRDIVFTYTLIGTYGGPTYFRGVNDTFTLGGEWRYPASSGQKETLQKNQTIAYGESYSARGVAGFNIRMVRPPVNFSDVLFYPGQLLKVDRVTSAQQVPMPVVTAGELMSVDRLGSVQPATSAGNYAVYSEYSDATAAQLEAAGTTYPDWVNQFAFVPPGGYRTSQVLAKIHNLALDVTKGTSNPYDAATAIESYLRDSSRFTYSLDVSTPQGRDPLDYFLFDSHKGYCEYFATAMGDMLRSLGIPTRLVNGYGPGAYDSTVNSYVVRGEDAHTWVEAYFPSYGWIPFEPTADNGNVYHPIIRGASGSCLRDAGCDNPIQVGVPGGAVAPPSPRSRDKNDPGTGPQTGGITGTVLAPGSLTKAVAVILAILLLALALAARYLRPRTVMSVWRRTLALADLAGAERRPGETPMELGGRLKRSFPETAEPVEALTSSFAVAAYAPPDEAATMKPSVMEAWTSLRPMLLRRVLARLRRTRN